MTYYMVTIPGKQFRRDAFTIPGELFTSAEFFRLSVPDRYGFFMRPEWVHKVSAPKGKTYVAFGVRKFARGYVPGE